MIQIGYTTEISKLYIEGLRSCNSWEGLREFLNDWKELASDAIQIASSKDFDWQEYLKGEKSERRGRYSGDEWTKKYGAILLPKIILFVGFKASQFKVPDGCMFIRLKEFGFLKENKGIYEIVDEPRKDSIPPKQNK